MSESQAAMDPMSPKPLGLSRWVQLAFVAFWMVLVLIFDKIITIVWDKFAEPMPVVITGTSVVLAFVASMLLYRNEKVSRISNEVVGELAKVSWPSRDEIQAATIVVIVTSLIASMIVGAFDAAWSAITDLIYKV